MRIRPDSPASPGPLHLRHPERDRRGGSPGASLPARARRRARGRDRRSPPRARPRESVAFFRSTFIRKPCSSRRRSWAFGEIPGDLQPVRLQQHLGRRDHIRFGTRKHGHWLRDLVARGDRHDRRAQPASLKSSTAAFPTPVASITGPGSRTLRTISFTRAGIPAYDDPGRKPLDVPEVEGQRRAALRLAPVKGPEERLKRHPPWFVDLPRPEVLQGLPLDDNDRRRIRTHPRDRPTRGSSALLLQAVEFPWM